MSDGLEIERVPGGDPVLVFLHEGLGSVAAWRGYPNTVATTGGRSALLYSRRGYGGSPGRPAPWPVTFMHEEAYDVLPELLASEGIAEAILVGHSDGASIALLAAARGVAGVVGVVAIAPHVIVEDVTVASIAKLRDAYRDPTTRLREKLARSIFGRDASGASADRADAVVEAWTGVWLDPAFRAWDLRAEIANVKVPVLVIQGDADAYGTLAQVDEVCARIGGARRLVIPGASHSPFRDAADAVRDAILGFVRDVSSR